VSTLDVVVSSAGIEWKGSQVKPKVKVSWNGEVLKSGTEYTLSYGANKNIGKGTVKVTGKGDFTGSRTLKFTITPKKVKLAKATAGEGTVSVSWVKASVAQKISQYQLQRRMRGDDDWTTSTYRPNISSATLKTRSGAYQFRVRACKTVSGKKYCAPWSAVKTSPKVK
jgi:hypothetical protein